MRLITKRAAAGAILAYDSEIRLLQTQTYSLEAEGIIRFYNMMTSIFDGDVLDAMYGDSVISHPAGNPPFLTNDKKALNELKSQLHFIKSINNFNISIENKLKVQAKTTIDVLKKEYLLQ